LAYHVAAATAGITILTASWYLIVKRAEIPPYILPDPALVIGTLIKDWSILGPAMWVTACTTVLALTIAFSGGVLAAIVLDRWRFFEMLVSPVTVMVQVMPVIAVAPLILVYVDNPQIAQLSCAFLVAFFPIMVNALHGLKSVDQDQADTVRLYTASKWKMLVVLKMPSSLPNLFAGLKIGGGLALVGTVVSEFAAGSAGANSGLAFRLLEAQYRLNTPRLFAALALLAVLGATIFVALSCLDRIVLRHWYASRASR
jgi:NitT/TauT family transport system permease protein